MPEAARDVRTTIGRRDGIAERSTPMTADWARQLRREAMEIYESGVDTHNALGLIAEATKIERELGIEPQINPKEWAHLKPEPIKLEPIIPAAYWQPERQLHNPTRRRKVKTEAGAIIELQPAPAQLTFF